MFKSKKMFMLIAAILLLTAFVTGCGGNEDTEEPAEQEDTADSNDNNNNNEENAAQNDDVRVVEHAMGETEIEGTPERIVTLYQGATDVAVALGVEPVGAVESWLEKPMYTYLRDDTENTQIVGLETQPNLEEIAQLDPDLIVASKLRHEEIYDQLSQIAPTVTHETVFKFKETTELMGKAMNKEDKANELLEEWDNRVADFREKISGKLGDEWPIKTSVLNFRADHARIYITGYAGDILGELGFVKSEYQQEEEEKGTVVAKLTDKESIPHMNGDVFFVFLSDPGDNEAVQQTYEEWTSHPLWEDLDAVKADQVYQIDEVAWNMAGGILSAHEMLDQLYEHFELEQ